VEDIQATYRGMMIAIPAPKWQVFEQMPTDQFAIYLRQWAVKVNLKRFSLSPKITIQGILIFPLHVS
jgi:hypothetical protein